MELTYDFPRWGSWNDSSMVLVFLNMYIYNACIINHNYRYAYQIWWGYLNIKRKLVARSILSLVQDFDIAGPQIWMYNFPSIFHRICVLCITEWFPACWDYVAISAINGEAKNLFLVMESAMFQSEYVAQVQGRSPHPPRHFRRRRSLKPPQHLLRCGGFHRRTGRLGRLHRKMFVPNNGDTVSRYLNWMEMVVDMLL